MAPDKSRTAGQGRSDPSGPPGPTGHWLAGNLADYERDRLGFVRAAHQRYGPIVAFDKRTTLLAEPTLMADVLRSPAVGISHDVLLRPLSRTQAGKLAAARQLLSPATRRTTSRRIASLVEAELRTAMRDLQHRSIGQDVVSEPVSLLEPVISRAVNVYFFGPSSGLHLAPRIRELLDDLSRLIGNTLAPPPSWRTPLRRRLEARHATLSRDIEAIVLSRRKAPQADLVSDVATHPALDEHPARLVADLIVGSLLASQRVPAAAAAWMLHLIATHPSHQGRLRVNADRKDSAAQEYAQAVAFESLRLYPATWMLQRTVLDRIDVADFRFGAGHTLMMSPFVVHRTPAYFARPDDFLPTRWLGSGSTHTPRAGFIPFGDGPHVCPGRHLALEILVAIAMSTCGNYVLAEEGRAVRADPRTTLLPIGSRLRLSPVAA